MCNVYSISTISWLFYKYICNFIIESINGSLHSFAKVPAAEHAAQRTAQRAVQRADYIWAKLVWTEFVEQSLKEIFYKISQARGK